MGETVWYCSNCGDGPLSSWNPGCICGHSFCEACIQEDTEEPSPAKGSNSEKLEDTDTQQPHSKENEAISAAVYNVEDFDGLSQVEDHLVEAAAEMHRLEAERAIEKDNAGKLGRKFSDSTESGPEEHVYDKSTRDHFIVEGLDTRNAVIASATIFLSEEAHNNHSKTALDYGINTRARKTEMGEVKGNSRRQMSSAETGIDTVPSHTFAPGNPSEFRFQPNAAITPSNHSAITSEDDERLSMYAESVFSDGSMGSSATGISATGSYAEAEILTATKELLKIFVEDPHMVQLYRRAIKSIHIGPERLKRNLYRLIHKYSQNLKEEAQSELERLASQLVAVKARYVAQCILEEFHVRPTPQRHHDSDEEDEDDELPAIDEDRFEDIATLRRYLVESAAFKMLREQLDSFVHPKISISQPQTSLVLGSEHVYLAGDPYTPHMFQEEVAENSPSTPDLLSFSNEPASASTFSDDRGLGADTKDPVVTPGSKNWLVWTTLRYVCEAALISAGCLELPLQQNMFRIRWQCKCGDLLYGDAQQYREGGISKLVDHLQQSAVGEVTVTSHESGTAGQRYTSTPFKLIQRAAKSLVRIFSANTTREEILPSHNRLDIPATPGSTNIEIHPVPNVLLLGCEHKKQGGKMLRQDSISTIETDRDLFCLLQRELSCTRVVGWSSLPLRTVIGIHFTKFHLRLENDVEPRLHERCCRESACQCVPTPMNPEYNCTPPGPLDWAPPVLPQQMLHYLKHPHTIHKNEKSVYNQLPKRMCGQLEATGEGPAEGWGLYYEEDWNIGLIIGVIAATSIFASLVFGICWTMMEADIQGAWGVSSYMVTTCALVVALLSMIGRSKSD